MEAEPMVPLDSSLFTPSLGSAFGLPGFGSHPRGPPSAAGPPPSFRASAAPCLYTPHLHYSQAPAQAFQQAPKPVARWGGAAKEELVRRQQFQHHLEASYGGHQAGVGLHAQFKPAPEAAQDWSTNPTEAAAQRHRGAFQALQRWAAGEELSSGVQACGMSVGSSGKQHPLQQQRSSFDSGKAAAFQQQRSSFEAAQQRPSFESVVAAAQNRPSFESAVAAAQQQSSFDEGVAAAMQQQRSSFERQQQQKRSSFEGGVAASSQLYHAQQQYMAAQINFQQQQHQHQQQQQQYSSRQQSMPMQSFNPFGAFPLQHGGPVDISQQMLTGCTPSYCMPPQYQQQQQEQGALGPGSTTGRTGTDTTEEDDDQGNARTIKRARLVWTPQLHKRFEEAVEKLGHEKAVPKNIMQEMNIEGLTRENVASHLQKWRLLEKKNRDRMSAEGKADL